MEEIAFILLERFLVERSFRRIEPMDIVEDIRHMLSNGHPIEGYDETLLEVMHQIEELSNKAYHGQF